MTSSQFAPTFPQDFKKFKNNSLSHGKYFAFRILEKRTFSPCQHVVFPRDVFTASVIFPSRLCGTPNIFLLCFRYTYQDVVNPWVANGAVRENSKPKWKRCNPKSSPAEIAILIENTKPLQDPVNFTTGPLTFKVQRNPNCSTSEYGEEMLEVRAKVDYMELFSITAYAFHPAAWMGESLGCGEFLGTTANFPHVGTSPKLQEAGLVWRMGIRRQLEVMGRAEFEYIVVTLAGSEANQHNITFTDASVIYSKN